MKLRTSETKPTENPEQLLARFDKRIKQLTARQEEIKGCLLYTSPSPRDR